MNALELADKAESVQTWEYGTTDEWIEQAAAMLRQQQAEIDRLKYDLDGFKQNFFVSGFHLQIKMANEQLLKQQEQIDALKSELDRAVELYTDKDIENEALKKSHIELERGIVKDLNQRQRNEPVAWMVERTTGTKGYGDTPYVTLLDATKSTYWIENKIPEGYTVIPLYTHPIKEQLTDEEIKFIAYPFESVYTTYDKQTDTDTVHTRFDQLGFARAILRKAQEK